MSFFIGMCDGKMSLRWVLDVMLVFGGGAVLFLLDERGLAVNGVIVLYLTFLKSFLECALIFSCVGLCFAGLELFVGLVGVVLWYVSVGIVFCVVVVLCSFVEVCCMLIFGSVFGMLCFVSLGSVF